MMKVFALAFLLTLTAVAAVAQAPPPSIDKTRSSPGAWTSWNSEPSCAPAATSGTITLTLSGCATPVDPMLGGSPGSWQFTLSGNATLAVTGAHTGQPFFIKVTEGTPTPFTLSVPTSFSVQGLCTGNLAPVGYCTAANQLALSGVAGGKNILSCTVINTIPNIWCGPVLAGLTTASPYIITAHTPGVVCSNGTTCATTMTLTAGGTLFAGIGYCQASDCIATGSNAVTGLAGTGLSGCSVATNAKSGIARGIWAEIWKCTGVPTGSTTVTATIGGAGGFYTNMMLAEVASALTDDGKGGYATSTTTSSSSSVSTTPTSQPNEFIFAYTMLISNAGPLTPGAGYSLLDDFNGGSGDVYSVNNVQGVNTAIINFGSAVSGSASAVAAFR